MNRMFTKFCFFVLFGFALLVIVSSFYVNTNQYKSLNDLYKFNTIPDSIEILNLGNSHGRNSFEYKYFDLNGFNFALTAQDFYYDKSFLLQYLSKVKKDSPVLINISYFSLYYDYAPESIDLKSPRYYPILDKKYILDYSFFDMIRYKYLPVIGSGRNFFSIIRDKSTYKNGWVFKKKNSFRKEELQKIAYLRAFWHKKNNISNGLSKRALSELQDIIKICRKNRLKPVLITPPYYYAYNNNFSSSFYDEFFTVIDSIAQKNSIPYIDYSHSKDFTYDRNLFMDTDHLNAAGRIKFSEIIFNKLDSLSIFDFEECNRNKKD